VAMLLSSVRVIKVAGAFSLLLLIGFEIVPTISVSDTQQYIIEAGFQRGRSQQIERDAYMLQYGSVSEKAQAFSNLRVSLNAFQQEQTLLWKNLDSVILRTLNDIQVDYFAISTAAQALLVHPDSIIEFNIILLHSSRFFRVIDDLVVILQQQLADRTTQLLIIRTIIIVICMCMVTSFLFLDHYMFMHKEDKGKKSEEP
jgi:hypothetical protein